MKQMTLFEIEAENADYSSVDFDTTPEEEIVRIIGCATGIDFKYKDDFWKWTAKTKHVDFDVGYGNYNTLDERHGQRFIGCGYNYHKAGNIGGAHGPCDSIEEAINFFKTGIERWMQ